MSRFSKAKKDEEQVRRAMQAAGIMNIGPNMPIRQTQLSGEDLHYQMALHTCFVAAQFDIAILRHIQSKAASAAINSLAINQTAIQEYTSKQARLLSALIKFREEIGVILSDERSTENS